MTEVRLYGRMIDRPRLEVGVAMDNLVNEINFLFDPTENPYIANDACIVFLKMDTLHIPCKLPLTLTRLGNYVSASIAFSSSTIPYSGSYTGQLQIEVPHPQGGFFVWQSLPFELLVAHTVNADQIMDSQLSGAYDHLFSFERAEAERVRAEAERQQQEEARAATMNRLESSLNHTIDLIEHIEGTLDADQLGIGISGAYVNTENGHLLITLTSGRTLDAGVVMGPQGNQGIPGSEVVIGVQEGYIVWKYADASDYRQLVDLAALRGADGKQPTLRVADNAIQWRLGDGAWQELISIEVLKGQDGADGTSFKIQGMYPTTTELAAAHPTGSAGDAYAIGTPEQNTIYLWDMDHNAWTDIGSIKGDKGDSFTFDQLTQEQKESLCAFTEVWKDKVSQLCERVNQDVSRSASPSFTSLTAQTIQADRVIGAVYI